MVTTYDRKSYELAAHFLRGTRQYDDASDVDDCWEELKQRTHSLACAIQQAVEDWMEDDAVPNVPGMQP